MTVPVRIERPFRVRFDECGADGYARASAYLRWAQDVAWVHSESGGFDRAWYAARGMAWLVRCLRLDLRAPLESGRTVRVSTEVVGWRRVWARRVSEIRPLEADAGPDRTGPALATVVTDWVLLGARGQPVRVPTEILAAFAARLPGFEPGRVPSVDPAGADRPEAEPSHHLAYRVRPQELDPMGHVNHAVYLDWLEEAVAAGGGQAVLARLPRRYRLEYARAVEPDAEVEAEVWIDPAGAWAWRLRGRDGGTVGRRRPDLARGDLAPSD